jgi:hypothetical protein
MRSTAYLLSLLLLVSCASYNPGKYADVTKGEHPANTPINAEIGSAYSYKPFTFINFTFGNRDTEWRRVKRVTVTNIGGEKDARIIVGPDLVSWAQGTSRRARIDAHNTQVILGAVAGAFAIGAGVSSYKGNSKLAGGLAAGALTAASIADINRIFSKIDSLELSRLVPPEHIYTPFSIPPSLYLTKWLVVQMPKGKRVRFLEFDVEYLSGKSASYRVELKGQGLEGV